MVKLGFSKMSPVTVALFYLTSFDDCDSRRSCKSRILLVVGFDTNDCFYFWINLLIIFFCMSTSIVW